MGSIDTTEKFATPYGVIEMRPALQERLGDVVVLGLGKSGLGAARYLLDQMNSGQRVTSVTVYPGAATARCADQIAELTAAADNDQIFHALSLSFLAKGQEPACAPRVPRVSLAPQANPHYRTCYRILLYYIRRGCNTRICYCSINVFCILYPFKNSSRNYCNYLTTVLL